MDREVTGKRREKENVRALSLTRTFKKIRRVKEKGALRNNEEA